MGAQKLNSKQRNDYFSVQYVESRTGATFESIGPEKATGAGLGADKIRNFLFLTLRLLMSYIYIYIYIYI
jgi:hypothetical protein